MTASRSRQYDVGIEEANANTLAHTSYQIYVPAVSLAMQSPSHFVSQKVLPLPSLWHVLWQSLKHCLYWSNSVWDRATWTAVANTMHSTSTTAILLAIVDSTFFFFFFLDFFFELSNCFVAFVLGSCQGDGEGRVVIYRGRGWCNERTDHKGRESVAYRLWHSLAVCANFAAVPFDPVVISKDQTRLTVYRFLTCSCICGLCELGLYISLLSCNGKTSSPGRTRIGLFLCAWLDHPVPGPIWSWARTGNTHLYFIWPIYPRSPHIFSFLSFSFLCSEGQAQR